MKRINDPQFIFLFILDAVRKDHVGLYGYERRTTPNIDKLSEQADVYNWAFAPSSFTLPSVPSIFAGKYPIELSNLFTGGEFDDSDFATLKAMKERGYKTAMFTANIVTSHYQSNLYKFFDFFWDELTERELNRKDMLFQKAGRVLTAAQDFIEKDRKTKLFVAIHLMEAHGPYVPEKRLIFRGDKLYKQDKRRVARVANDSFTGVTYDLLKKETVMPKYQLLDLIEGPDGEIEDFEKNINEYIAKYDMGIYSLDKALGEFFKFLRSKNIFDNSKIIITSDHGEALGEENIFFSHGIYTSPELVNIPLIIKDVGQRGERRINKNYSLTSIVKEILGTDENKNEDIVIYSFHPKSLSLINNDNFLMIHSGDLDVIDNKEKHLFETPLSKEKLSLDSESRLNLFQWFKTAGRFQLRKKRIHDRIRDTALLEEIKKQQSSQLKKNQLDDKF